MKRIISLPLGFHTRNPSGKIRKNVEISAERIEDFVAHHIPDIAYAFVSPAALIALFLYFDFRIALSCLIPIFLAFIIQDMLMGKKASAKFVEAYQGALGEMNNAAVEYVRGISVIKTFGQTTFSFKTFYDSIKNYGDYSHKYAMSMRTPYTAFATIVNSSFLFLVAFGLIFVNFASDYRNFVLSFVFYAMASSLVSITLMKLMYVNSYSLLVKMAIEDVYKLLSEKPLKEFHSEGIKSNDIKPKNFDVEFKGVAFRYEDTEVAAVENINFKASQNTITALVGASGSGKSTIAGLIPRFYDIDEGSIEIGGVDIRRMDYSKLMETVSFVFQDNKLLSGTIFENVKCGNLNASEEEVMNAMKLARCEDIINKFPKGADTKIGTNGVYLSGGETQRIAIARAILKNAPIIVLDEASSFADPENEYEIRLAINKLIKDKTAIMIAHRLSAIKNANQILVLERGNIAERGTHFELMALNGIYKRMCDNYEKTLSWSINGR